MNFPPRIWGAPRWPRRGDSGNVSGRCRVGRCAARTRGRGPLSPRRSDPSSGRRSARAVVPTASVTLSTPQGTGQLRGGHRELPEGAAAQPEPRADAAAAGRAALPPRQPAGGARELQGEPGRPGDPQGQRPGSRRGQGAGADTAFSAPPQRCLQLEPYNEVCQYMKGLSHVAMGQFYDGIKAQTKVMLNDPLPGQKASPEYLKVKYLRGESQPRGSVRRGLDAVEIGCCLSRMQRRQLRAGEAEQPAPAAPRPPAGPGRDRVAYLVRTCSAVFLPRPMHCLSKVKKLLLKSKQCSLS